MYTFRVCMCHSSAKVAVKKSQADTQGLFLLLLYGQVFTGIILES